LAQALAAAALASGCAGRQEPTPGFYPPIPETHAAPARAPIPLTATDAPPSAYQAGIASWYGAELAGRRTASGERFDPRAMTAAHRGLPFDTWVEVRRVDTGRTVRVRINDRGPNARDSRRVIDLSRRAAEQLDMIREGMVKVEIRLVRGPD
jgi:rare lipoprotein A